MDVHETTVETVEANQRADRERKAPALINGGRLPSFPGFPVEAIFSSRSLSPRAGRKQFEEEGSKEGVENMKNLYPKGKGKIYPSPATPSASSGVAGGQGVDALAVLKLVPAAILALTVALGNEDTEVLAYLIARSMNGPGMGERGGGGDERQRSRQVGGVHRPIFDCGCFDCYISFWSRWNCSPDRELIHQVIEAFEEHLTNSESKAEGGGERGRRRERRERRASDRSGKRKNNKEEEEKKKAAETTEEKVLEIAAVSFSGEEKAPEGDGEERRKAEEEAAAGGERRGGWPDVIGWFKCPWWSLWSPGV